MTNTGFTTQQVIGITGLTHRQLNYWRKTGLIVPSLTTRGGHARYTFTDLIAFKAARKLLDAGVSVQHLRKCITSLIQILPTLNRPLNELSLVVTGDVILVFHQGEAFEALTGQEWVLPVAHLMRDIEQWHSGNKEHTLVKAEPYPAKQAAGHPAP